MKKILFKYRLIISITFCLAASHEGSAQYNRPEGPSTDPRMIELEKPTVIPEIIPTPDPNKKVMTAPAIEEPNNTGTNAAQEDNDMTPKIEVKHPASGNSNKKSPRK
ncbi:MAG TPA: hypothetical protein DHV17_03705 [Chitinophagaceae bacterium]|nr:hypothetical protein [Chitinophagaceae bacterium]HRF26594.1 hypothetical protein [Ferruginibacter sp.]